MYGVVYMQRLRLHVETSCGNESSPLQASETLFPTPKQKKREHAFIGEHSLLPFCMFFATHHGSKIHLLIIEVACIRPSVAVEAPKRASDQPLGRACVIAASPRPREAGEACKGLHSANNGKQAIAQSRPKSLLTTFKKCYQCHS